MRIVVAKRSIDYVSVCYDISICYLGVVMNIVALIIINPSSADLGSLNDVQYSTVPTAFSWLPRICTSPEVVPALYQVLSHFTVFPMPRPEIPYHYCICPNGP